MTNVERIAQQQKEIATLRAARAAREGKVEVAQATETLTDKAVTILHNTKEQLVGDESFFNRAKLKWNELAIAAEKRDAAK